MKENQKMAAGLQNEGTELPVLRESSRAEDGQKTEREKSLLPCPFCGNEKPWLEKKGKLFVRGSEHRSTFVKCNICGAMSHRYICNDFDDPSEAYACAKAAWNRRTAEQ